MISQNLSARATNSSRPIGAERVAGFGSSIFAEMSALAAQHHAINLSQGFPDFAGPEWVKAVAEEAIAADLNQYAISSGQPGLRQAIARKVGAALGRTIDPTTEVTVTSGATEAIFATLVALLDPGDELVVFEPFYDSYLPSIRVADAVPRFVPLRPPDSAHADWWYDSGELAAAFGPQTRVVLLNTPHNPTGKVFTMAELGEIADLCQHWDAFAVCDEVYEHIVFPGSTHRSLASLPGMWERTVTISSAGKTFSVTGWKIGWLVAPAAFNLAVRRLHQFIVFAVSTPMQEAIATALDTAPARGYYEQLAAEYTERRDLLLGALRAAGLYPFEPAGAYFILIDLAGLGFADDVTFCRYFTRDVGVAAIPPSFFYSADHRAMGQQLARFCFCKKTETLNAAAERLLAWREKTEDGGRRTKGQGYKEVEF